MYTLILLAALGQYPLEPDSLSSLAILDRQKTQKAVFLERQAARKAEKKERLARSISQRSSRRRQSRQSYYDALARQGAAQDNFRRYAITQLTGRDPYRHLPSCHRRRGY